MTNVARCWLKEQSDVLQPHKVERASTAGSLPDEDSDHCRFGGAQDGGFFFRIDPVSHQWKCGGIYRLQVATFEVAMTRVAILTWYIQCIYLYIHGDMYISRYTYIGHTSSDAFSIPRMYVCIYIYTSNIRIYIYIHTKQSLNWYINQLINLYILIYITQSSHVPSAFSSLWVRTRSLDVGKTTGASEMERVLPFGFWHYGGAGMGKKFNDR